MDQNISYEKKRVKNIPQYLVDSISEAIPVSIKDLFKVARAVVAGNEIVRPVAHRVAETPLTEIIVRGKSEKVTPTQIEILKNILTDLKVKERLQAISHDYFAYQNAFATLYFAPVRYLVCPLCSKDVDKNAPEKGRFLMTRVEWKFKIERNVSTKLDEFKFNGKCPQCKRQVVFEVKDVHFRSSKQLRLITWDPNNIEIDHYRLIGKSKYYYAHPREELNKIRAGDRIMLTEYPWNYLTAAINNRLLEISEKGFWHFKDEFISGLYDGWGAPKIMAVIGALYTLMQLVKANESTSEGRINDLTIISPQPRQGAGGIADDPLAGLGVQGWLSNVSNVFEKYKKDKTLTAFLPFPVRSDSVYGQGRMQLVTGELEVYIRNIIGALGLPEDVIYSGGTYTSIAVAARIMANEAVIKRKKYNEFLTAIKDVISDALRETDFSEMVVELEPYENPDDIQKTNMMMQLALSDKFPWTPIYKRLGWEFKEVVDVMKVEAKEFTSVMQEIAKSRGKATGAGEAIAEYMRMQLASEIAKSNRLESASADMLNTGVQSAREKAAVEMAQQILNEYPSEDIPQVLQVLTEKDPELGALVQQIIEQQAGQGQQSQNGQTQENQVQGQGQGQEQQATEEQYPSSPPPSNKQSPQAPDKRPPRGNNL